MGRGHATTHRGPTGGRRVASLAAALGLAVALTGTAGFAGPASAAVGATAPGAAVGTSLVRVAHLSPDTKGVDVYVDGHRALGNVDFETVSDYQTLPAGRHRLALRPAGAAATSAPVLATTQDLQSQEAYTVAGVGANADLEGRVFDDDLTSPAAGTAKVRVIHAAVGVAAVDAALGGGPTLGDDLGFGKASAYTQVPAGRYSLSLVRHGSGEPVLDPTPLDLGAGIVYTVAAIGGTAGAPVQVLPLVDARGAQVLPAGALRTGAGGAATQFVDSSRPADDGSGRDRVPVLFGAAVVVIAGGVMIDTARRRRRG